MNGKVIVGQKIKAALISEINPQFGSGTRKRSKINKMEIEDNGENENFDKKMSIDEDKKKSISILERIRKNR